MRPAPPRRSYRRRRRRCRRRRRPAGMIKPVTAASAVAPAAVSSGHAGFGGGGGGNPTGGGGGGFGGGSGGGGTGDHHGWSRRGFRLRRRHGQSWRRRRSRRRRRHLRHAGSLAHRFPVALSARSADVGQRLRRSAPSMATPTARASSSRAIRASPSAPVRRLGQTTTISGDITDHERLGFHDSATIRAASGTCRCRHGYRRARRRQHLYGRHHRHRRHAQNSLPRMRRAPAPFSSMLRPIRR